MVTECLLVIVWDIGTVGDGSREGRECVVEHGMAVVLG